MNLLAFDSIREYKEVLHDNTFVQIKHRKWQVAGNEVMKKYAYATWQPDARFVILLNLYKNEEDSQRVKSFKGERLCVIDSGDSAKYWKPFVDVADIYIKENSYTPTRRKNVRIGCYSPYVKVPFLLKRHKIRWRKRRLLKVVFCGDMSKGRAKRLNYWRKLCNRRKWIHRFGDEHTYGRPRYLGLMSKSLYCPSLVGYGTRCRREWEVLLCGGVLINDSRLKKYPFVIIQAGKHFVFSYKDGDMDIARAGYELSRKCWMQSPSINIRMAALYTFFNHPQMWTYEDVEVAERKHKL